MNELKMIKIIAAVCLVLVVAGGFMLWQKGWIGEEFSLAGILKSGVQKTEQISLLKILPQLAGFGEERNYLLLFQNNLELRPSGGYLGAFGIIKIKNAEVVSFEMHDTNIFDGFGRTQTEPPKPIKDYLHINNWQMRDSNWSPDWPTASQQIEYFYRLQGGQENFDGIIAVNADVLPSLLKLTGPIYLEEFDKEFVAENALYQLEYEVEKGYVERGIETGERKAIFKALVKKALEKSMENGLLQKEDLRKLIINELNQKNILLFFDDSEEQETVNKLGWSGQVNQSHQGDYLMIVEANLGAGKSNAFIKREVEYFVDFSEEIPKANLKIKYIHSNEEKDWFNNDYRVYLRIYVPDKSWLLASYGMDGETEFLEDLGKTVFGHWVVVPAGETKTVEFSYLLPASIATQSIAGRPDRLKNEMNYQILVQKQSGIDNLPFKLLVKGLKGDKIIEKETIIINALEEEALIQ